MTVFAWFALRGATLALMWFCLLNLAASVPVALAARRLTANAQPRPALVWLGLRLFGVAAALIFVCVVFLPSYWVYEPRDSVEGFDVLLTAGAAATCLALAAGAFRGVASWRSATRRTRAWMQSAQPLALPGTTIPAFVIDVDAAVLALVGIVRPRLLVTRGLLAALTAEELAAAVAHEIDHSHAWDNLTRLALRSLPDIVPATSSLRAIERQWAAAAEHRADRAASEHNPHARCSLASALVKVARLTPPLLPLSEPISLLIGGGDIASRVRRLLDDRGATAAGPTRGTAAWTAAMAVVATLVLTYPSLLHAVHEATEVLVRSLP